MIIVNWQAFNGNPQLEMVRCYMIFFVVLCVFLNIMMGGAGSQVDYLGHIGGSITGLIWGLAFLPRANTPGGATCKKVGLGLTVVFFGLCTGLLFGLNPPK